jgi:hypothetical protein
MGLDMYLNKTLRVEGFKPEDYDKVDNAVHQHLLREEKPIETLDLEAATNLKGANTLLPALKNRGSDTFIWYSIFEEAAYWRKANQIHNWFVEHVQNGVDDCGTYEVSKEALESLLETAGKVRLNTGAAEELLPTASGFFFGGTDYDEWYMQDIENTISMMVEVLERTDFKTDILFYHSSW